jgi:hypothetical protein
MSVIAADARAELTEFIFSRSRQLDPVKRVIRYDESFVAEWQEFVGAVRENPPTLWLELTPRSNPKALAKRKSYD